MKNDSFYVIICQVRVQGKRKKKNENYPRILGCHNYIPLTRSDIVNYYIPLTGLR